MTGRDNILPWRKNFKTAVKTFCEAWIVCLIFSFQPGRSWRWHCWLRRCQNVGRWHFHYFWFIWKNMSITMSWRSRQVSFPRPYRSSPYKTLALRGIKLRISASQWEEMVHQYHQRNIQKTFLTLLLFYTPSGNDFR